MDRRNKQLSFFYLIRSDQISLGLDRQPNVVVGSLHSIVSIGFYELCFSPRVAKDRKQKEINPLAPETTKSACIIIIIIDIIMSIQHSEFWCKQLNG